MRGPDRVVPRALYVGWPWQEKYRNAGLDKKYGEDMKGCGEIGVYLGRC